MNISRCSEVYTLSNRNIAFGGPSIRNLRTLKWTYRHAPEVFRNPATSLSHASKGMGACEINL
jgi:hypothetical protein